MNVVVCLCSHARSAGELRFELRLNDRRALALACALTGERQVIAVLAGAKDEAGALAAALAAGADRAIRIASDGLASADFHTLGQVLARALRSLAPDLVLAGAHADTEGLGALSASIARHLGVPHLANIESLERRGGGDRPAGERPSLAVTIRGGGRRRLLAVEPPLVMSVAAGAVPPRDLATAKVDDGDGDGDAAGLAARIEVLSLPDPEATVLRRRTEILGTSEAIVRTTTTVGSAAELVAALIADPVR